MREEDLTAARDRLLETAVTFFSNEPGVRGIFLAGSLAAGTADAWSDIDLRVVVAPERHRHFVENRRTFPERWPGFLFNEWLAGTIHCVSHFRPFGKIDIFYYSADALAPSPWYRLPIKVLFDPENIVADLLERSRALPFTVAHHDLDIAISKGLSAAHEAYRRARRGELFYAQSLLDELREHIMRADDWLNDRTPENAVIEKFHQRADAATLATLRASYCACEAEAILAALRALAEFYRAQLVELHEKFDLSRSLAVDLEALDIIGSAQALNQPPHPPVSPP